MSSLQTARFSLPLLSPGQASKEVFHNEALSLIDFLLHPVVENIANDPQLLSPGEGQSWLVGTSPLGEWQEHSGHIAGWTAGGWRYIRPQENMRIVVSDERKTLIYRDNLWVSVGAILPPAGGSNIDPEARVAIDSILDILQLLRIAPDGL
ncbi:DUF2793 domain-containing protein [Parasphingorhabdus halotolerans]|uniref:DUF2793 domain-containing protein n=1 Tax=Parasphingorhabdus halotolerans TaxID=2725558 RepID=A0A6H2DLX3_9SPHN|nr:DUF2793 domain-containing protein [Parasphingorhabdus halotolerans]QJB69380.1 DUF2793 domain-containing protein [Parasphingorhabdus halotolerans]